MESPNLSPIRPAKEHQSVRSIVFGDGPVLGMDEEARVRALQWLKGPREGVCPTPIALEWVKGGFKGRQDSLVLRPCFLEG